ncbi:6-phosphogluconate dehydrogenase C-terminal domain-like protein [Atractiella rhizophila]|nr:6-phosphogluconate dehydrogenase C-terminal domain-like protein [Atractiella rhizophila]
MRWVSGITTCRFIISRRSISQGPTSHNRNIRIPAIDHQQRKPMSSDSSSKLDVLVIGFGAVGILYSYLLEKSGRARVTALARSNYNQALKDGVDVYSLKFGDEKNWRPHRLFSESAPEGARDRTYDWLICSSKNIPDLLPTSEILKPFVTKELPGMMNNILLLQNGFDIERPAQKAFEDLNIYSAGLWIACNLKDGREIHHAALERTVFGYYTDDNMSPARMEQGRQKITELIAILTSVGSTSELSPDVHKARFVKNLWNVSFSLACCMTRLPLPQLVHPSRLNISLPIVRELMNEAIGIAKAMGLQDEDWDKVAEETLNVTLKNAQAAHEDFKPSTLLDLENGRPMEIEVIIGNLVRRAEELNVKCPKLWLVYTALKVNQNIALQAQTLRIR